MKIIDTQKMIRVLQNCGERELNIDTLDMLLDKYGDEWYIVDGHWTKTVENQSDFVRSMGGMMYRDNGNGGFEAICCFNGEVTLEIE